jgi:hypothetical protein
MTISMRDSQPEGAFWSIDECVRAVTAFDSFQDLQSTESSYAPSFYPSKRHTSMAEVSAMERVCRAFNAWAERAGRERRANVYRIQAASEQRQGPHA